MKLFPDFRPVVAPTSRRTRRAAARCAGVIVVFAFVVAMLALQCDVYGAFARGNDLSLDGSGLQTLLASLGLAGGSTAR